MSLLDTRRSPSKKYQQYYDPFLLPDNNSHVSFRRSKSPSKKLSPIRHSVFSNNNKSPKRSDNYLFKPTLSSPTKFNVVTSDWNDENPLSKVPSLRSQNSKTSLIASRSPSPTRRSIKKTSTNDRFIPSRASSSLKLFNETQDEHQPNATDSPEKHIEYQAKRIYKHSMAELCGIETGQKILHFAPSSPERQSGLIFDLKNLTLNDNLSNVLEKSRSKNNHTGGINPSTALARSRKIPTIPERILDAPGLVDDYYLNLMSWSSNNLLAVALGNTVYIWRAAEGTVKALTSCDVQVTSVSWSDDGAYLSIGKDNGAIEVWDIEEGTKLRTMRFVNTTRIACHSWSNHLVTSGSVSGNMYHNDVRIAKHAISELSGFHSAEVCGISWRKEGNQFASGGNDNIVNIWDARSSVPLFTKKTHTAAVKALSWCDYQSSLLATGGGTNDKHIHFWNTNTGKRVNSLNTGAQITSLHWGRSSIGKEIVATNGYPHYGISMYQYPTLQKTGEILHPHDGRILYSALSPDGKILATAAGDENLKFWKIFDSERSEKLNDKEIKKVMTIR
ncbi:hypothetical protein DASC09_038000 [Saccharomycopsis crataegensis]|uniref:CDC20/Fizzy WD40 domain-containing protein n=1 Tax=Saccharomycopsis crataegensis TaxID=43959 RepID=A0AAV5QNI2_9ASCO|nr:hypothetical protein DASC09_038000 [Saccharomycopsis crataegensis]